MYISPVPEAIGVPCPKCRVAAGIACTGLQGAQRMHTARIHLYRAHSAPMPVATERARLLQLLGWYILAGVEIKALTVWRANPLAIPYVDGTALSERFHLRDIDAAVKAGYLCNTGIDGRHTFTATERARAHATEDQPSGGWQRLSSRARSRA